MGVVIRVGGWVKCNSNRKETLLASAFLLNWEEPKKSLTNNSKFTE